MEIGPPATTTLDDQGRTEKKIAPQFVWMTDFAAATEASKTLHRPLFVFFNLSWDQTSRQMRAGVLADPEVMQIVGERFVPVLADAAIEANKVRLMQYRVAVVPSIVVLSEDGEVLGISERDVASRQLVEMLDKISRCQPLKGEQPIPRQPSSGRTGRISTRFSMRAAIRGNGCSTRLMPSLPLALRSRKQRRFWRTSENNLKALQSLQTGTIPRRTIVEAEHEVLRNRAAVQRMTVDLDIKVRQLDEAREMLAVQIKFLELDLADAKLRMEAADEKLSRADEYYKKGAISTDRYDATRLDQRLAASQYERARMQLDLYRKALPDQEASANKDQSNADPQFKDVWMTDFDAAREKSLKLRGRWLHSSGLSGPDPARRCEPTFFRSPKCSEYCRSISSRSLSTLMPTSSTSCLRSTAFRLSWCSTTVAACCAARMES